MIEEVRIMLDKLLIGNDVAIINYILDYTYPKCYVCNQYFTDDKVFDMYDGGAVCIYCYTKLIYKKCYVCDKYYEFNCNIYCRSCIGACRIYCPFCLSIEYQGTKTISVIDDIISRIL